MKRMVAICALLLWASVAQAYECSECGCRKPCRKVCKLKCDEKEEKKFVYDCECEDFCVPGPSTRCGVKTVCDDDCGCKKHREVIWKPNCATVLTKAKLVKKEVVKKVPVYKWEVVEVCCECGHLKEKKKDDKKKEVARDEANQDEVRPVSHRRIRSDASDLEEESVTIDDEGDHDSEAQVADEPAAKPAKRGIFGALLGKKAKK